MGAFVAVLVPSMSFYTWDTWRNLHLRPVSDRFSSSINFLPKMRVPWGMSAFWVGAYVPLSSRTLISSFRAWMKVDLPYFPVLFNGVVPSAFGISSSDPRLHWCYALLLLSSEGFLRIFDVSLMC